VKFLVDRCAGRKLAKWLQSEGYDTISAASLGPDPGDLVLLQRAAAEARILVTLDSDFGRLVYISGEMHCGIVRLPDVRSEMRIEIMRSLILRHQGHLLKGSLITVRGERVRIS
jgi:predicted nuclease of predicted toxin-antitoxin system